MIRKDKPGLFLIEYFKMYVSYLTAHDFDGIPRRCTGNPVTNFWRYPNPVRYATIILRRNLTAQKAGIFTGTSCGKPTYKIKDISISF